MKKRTKAEINAVVYRTVGLILMLLLVSQSGCSSMFETEVYSISPYGEGSSSNELPGSDGVSDYDGIYSLLYSMTETHQDYGMIKLVNYEGNVSEDMQRAINEIISNTAVGAYTVNYIYPELMQIVSYYEATVSIAYKRSKEQFEAVETINGDSAVKERVTKLLGDFGETLAFRSNSAALTSEFLKDIVTENFYKYPLLVPVFPEIETAAFPEILPEAGDHRIFELKLNYGMPSAELSRMRSALNAEVMTAAAKISTAALSRSGDFDTALLLETCRYLAENCAYDPAFDMRRAVFGDDDSLGRTAYGAVKQGIADSEGFALGFMALCLELEIECLVIGGRYGKDAHMWNIVKLGGDYYHVDASMFDGDGGDGTSVLKSDNDMRAEYWWDTELYPACENSFQGSAPPD